MRDYLKFNLEKSPIVTITYQEGIISYPKDIYKISKCTKDELMGQDCNIINLDCHFKLNPHAAQLA